MKDFISNEARERLIHQNADASERLDISFTRCILGKTAAQSIELATVAEAAAEEGDFLWAL